MVLGNKFGPVYIDGFVGENWENRQVVQTSGEVDDT